MAGRVDTVFLDQLAADAAEAIRAASAHFIPAVLSPRFDAALRLVQTAADAGTTSDTAVASIVESGDGETLAAYRAQFAGVGPAEYPAAAYLPAGVSLAEIEDFASHDDRTERRQYIDPVWHSVGAGTPYAPLRSPVPAPEGLPPHPPPARPLPP